MAEKLDRFHYHELMDRLYVVMSTIDDHLTTHPVSEKHKSIQVLIEDAQIKLYKAYSLTGEIEFDFVK